MTFIFDNIICAAFHRYLICETKVIFLKLFELGLPPQFRNDLILKPAFKIFRFSISCHNLHIFTDRIFPVVECLKLFLQPGFSNRQSLIPVTTSFVNMIDNTRDGTKQVDHSSSDSSDSPYSSTGHDVIHGLSVEFPLDIFRTGIGRLGIFALALSGLQHQVTVGLDSEFALYRTQHNLNHRPDNRQIDNIHDFFCQFLGNSCRNVE